mmetsp:Transcript_96135/g.250404  ORF Transcript_96135/g.250404 Transcript_96135/m.250404 type:complete len:209 (-) Transcript_96135:639-1265(-)
MARVSLTFPTELCTQNSSMNLFTRKSKSRFCSGDVLFSRKNSTRRSTSLFHSASSRRLLPWRRRPVQRNQASKSTRFSLAHSWTSRLIRTCRIVARVKFSSLSLPPPSETSSLPTRPDSFSDFWRWIGRKPPCSSIIAASSARGRPSWSPNLYEILPPSFRSMWLVGVLPTMFFRCTNMSLHPSSPSFGSCTAKPKPRSESHFRTLPV